MKTLVAVIFFAVLFPASLGAQGSGSVPSSDLVVTRDVTGTIFEIDLEKNLVIVETEAKARYRFEIAKKTKLKAEKKSALAGKKKIELPDFQKGQPVRITYRPDKPEMATELRLLPAPSTAGVDL
ncbi:MAG TPA: hypothetical protein VMT00_07790 [Thermoanaerobaculia bacterium]|nr:hypothetical protein [Thermoanaerobaculia bacterium]